MMRTVHCFFDKEFHIPGLYYPLDKDCRPLTPEELVSNAPAVREASLKELSSWIKEKAGRPTLRTEYEQRTGLKPLPCRNVTEWKRKEGKRIVKDRLCLKGFAEQNQKSLATSSPTATRLGHRMVMQHCASHQWPLWSLDVSTAFLQGFTFAQLEELGMPRQPCAFVPPPGTFELLAELDSEWSVAAANPERYVFELFKGAYGLKDGPLLWYIRINLFLLSVGFKHSRHDVCVYYLIERDEIALLLSLHVDDTLVAGLPNKLQWLHAQLESKFGKVKKEIDQFRHFGVDIFRHPTLLHVYASQRSYLDQLFPIEVDRKRGDGRTIETMASPAEVTLFRSLVSAIAWLGVSYPPALAAASLYQAFLSELKIGHIVHLNAVLAQFKDHYQPLIFRHGIINPLLVVVADSCLGNNSNKSQGAHFVLLADRSDTYICGACSLLGYKSGKSKRVASSTLHAETLSLVAGCEEASHIQTWLLELARPTLSTFELISAQDSSLVPIIGITDCHDLLDTLVKPTAPVLTNKAMFLYTGALRELKESNRVLQWIWIDTRCNVANALTKLESDGTLPLEPLTSLLQFGAWEPTNVFKWGLVLCDPTPLVLKSFPPAPPPVVAESDTAKITVGELPL